MRRIVMNTFLSLDGVMQAPGGPGEDDDGGFPYGGWTVNYWDAKMMEVMGAALSTPVDLLMGRRTYDIFAAHWPKAPPEEGALFNEAHKYVATHRPESLDWGPVTALSGDIAGQLRALTATEGRDLSVQGSSDFGQYLLEHDLVDVSYVWLFPLTLGTGKRRFGPGTRHAGLRLVGQEVSSTGVMMLHYERGEAAPIGSFRLE